MEIQLSIARTFAWRHLHDHAALCQTIYPNLLYSFAAMGHGVRPRREAPVLLPEAHLVIKAFRVVRLVFFVPRSANRTCAWLRRQNHNPVKSNHLFTPQCSRSKGMAPYITGNRQGPPADRGKSEPHHMCEYERDSSYPLELLAGFEPAPRRR